ncbi:hypothetical protein RFI_08019 [Reticulomyxa filosa]|uniref:Uncharacterized protein n=1 Tax=Reticulomyxa filosa TaxID=46433 RepID=X6NT21_RETFI|nr:hypothetical protein RFI_08019 [Reticulomyxa filosa]|eukprot:ETO29108.1 hypothetical protein RFI_08019 [Reticulomyxa filosa]
MDMSETIQIMQEAINKMTDLNISSEEIKSMNNLYKKTLDNNFYQLMKKLFQLRTLRKFLIIIVLLEGIFIIQINFINKEFERYSNEHVFSNVFAKLKKKKWSEKNKH